jgi:uncharacterized protein (TIGR00661 family)
MKIENQNKRIAYFISPHGYGHAARASAVMEAIYGIDPEIEFDIFTHIPSWFFENSLSGRFEYYSVLTDIGLVQRTPFEVNLSETIRRLNHFFPLDGSRIKNLANLLIMKRCRLIVCDIAPMGIAVAQASGIPSVLVENFTWDWLYEGYEEYDERIKKYTIYLRELFDMADYHIQTAPMCRPTSADLTTPPVSRKARTSPIEIRKRLGIPEETKSVLITMGGIQGDYSFLNEMKKIEDICFIIAGAAGKKQVVNNLFILPHHSEFFHPDLVKASDAVISKVGYSTLAEVYDAGLPFGYIARRRFRESPILVSYIENQIKGLPIDADEFYDGRWTSCLPDLLSYPRMHRDGSSGATEISLFISDLLTRL